MRPAPDVWSAFPRFPLLDGWARWDSGWYLLVAQEGYRLGGAAGPLPPAVLPLYPLLVRLGAALLGDYALAGLVVSNLALLGAAVLLYRMVNRRLGQAAAARSVLFLCLFPFSFFASAAYPDALTLLLAVGALALLERGRSLPAGGLTALAVLTSPPGLALWVAVVVGFVARRRLPRLLDLVAALLPLASLGAFVVYLQRTVGEPSSLVRATVLGETSHGLLNGGLSSLTWDLATSDGLYLVGILTLGCALVILAGAALAPRALGAAPTAFALALLALPLAFGADSLGRWLGLAFPSFVALAALCGAPLAEGLVVATAPLFLGLCTLLFATWQPVDRVEARVNPPREAVLGVLGPSWQAATSGQRLDVELPTEYAVESHSMPERAAPGQTVAIAVNLRVLRPTVGRYVASVHLDDPTGRTLASADTALEPSSWAAGLTGGEVQTIGLSLTLPPDVPPGLYTPELFLFAAQSFERLPLVDARTGEPRRAMLGRLAILGPEDAPEPQASRPAKAANATLGGEIALRGFDLPSTAPRPGETLEVALYWQAVATPAADYTVFAQLLDESGKLVAQSDSFPLGGRYPTSAWRAGDYFRDTHRLTIPADYQGKSLSVIVGMYRLATLERLAVAADGKAAGDFVALGNLNVGAK